MNQLLLAIFPLSPQLLKNLSTCSKVSAGWYTHHLLSWCEQCHLWLFVSRHALVKPLENMKLAENLNYEFSFLRLQVQYCCASDKYRKGPKMETFLQGWKSGAAAVKSVFRKYEHDWTTVSLISYLLHEKCRCHSPLTSRVTESNLKNLPFYSFYS